MEADPRTAGTHDDQAADDVRPQPGTSAEGDAAAGRAAADMPARGTDEAAKREDPGPTPSPAVGVAAPRPTTPEAGRGAPVQAGAAEGRVQAAPGSSALTQALIARGDAMVARRDISAARLLYERAATAGDGRAAAALARTYDPAFLAEVGAHGIAADASLALAWYRKAASLGNDGARARVEALTRPDQATQGGP